MNCRAPSRKPFAHYQVLAELRLQEAMKDIPVIAVTANALPRDIERGQAAGFADYLTKPLDLARFQEMLARHLPGRQGDPP